MASTSSSTRAEPRFDDGPAMTASTAPFSGVEETLAKLAQQAAIHTPDPRTRGPQTNMRVDPRISPSSAAAMRDPATVGPAMPDPAMLGPADLGAQIAREPLRRRKRSTLARVVIALCLGAAALWGWRSYGGPAREMIATLAPAFGLTSARPAADQPPVPPMPDPAPAEAAAAPAVAPVAAAPVALAPVAAEPPPPPAQTTAVAPAAAPVVNEPVAAAADHQQIDAMARDVAALRQTVEQLTAGQEQLKGQIAKLEAEKAAAEKPPTEKPKRRVVRHVPSAPSVPSGIRTSDAFDPALSPNAPGAPRTIGSVVVHHAAPPPTSGVTTVGPLPPPQAPGVPRPPMPVQQP